jgi:transposase
MEGVVDDLLKSAAGQLRGSQRRIFLADVCVQLCEGNARQAENRFGWGRETIAKGLEELAADPAELATRPSNHRGKKRSEDQNPQLAIDIRLIVEPQTQADPELKTERLYTNVSAAEVRQALLARGYSDSELPSERTLRNILNRLNYRLKRIQKGKPLKKTEHTDEIFENVSAVRAAVAAEADTLEISVDTKTKVKLGEYSLGGKNPHGPRRKGRPRTGP